ncbi:hypothetical protein GGX14DRAFT_562803 [Mycena pura]|uniref:DNA binding HTH domain-containing protein n=1 Tax=Mycena pura TaxID=153505 RepID=A0AAD6YIA2_9AGAR|nr:hypothetical protein GGX14DRAFT_562803 [Mycena pura]
MDFDFPDNIPPLPPNPWSTNVQNAYHVIDGAYTRALQALRAEDGDALRYKLLSSNIIDTMIPVLEGMEGEVPREWIDSCAHTLGPLVYELQVSAHAAEGVERDEIELLAPVTEKRSGKRGRPKKDVDLDYLREATGSNRNIGVTRLADAIGVHRNTLSRKMRELGVDKRFDALDDDELDTVTRDYKAKKHQEKRFSYVAYASDLMTR